MMRRILPGTLTVLLLLFIFAAKAQVDSAINNNFKTYKVGIFAPLYLDSVFNASGSYKYKQNIPKFITPGADFVHGAEIALDSMNLWNANVQASIYDSKSYKDPISALIKNKKLDSLDLIIGSVKDAEYKLLAEFALKKNIPFISATYPNDGGITDNPFLVIVNSTLRAHCEAIHSYILQNYGTEKIFLCRQPGTQEDKVATYFKEINEQEGRPFLNIQTLNFDSTISLYYLKSKLDSTKQNIIIGGSLDEDFATSLASKCYQLYDNYGITLIGMPNWDNFKGLTKKDEFTGFPIYFTSPYLNAKTDGYSMMVNNGYAKRFRGKPTDMAFKGFECTYLFTKLLIKHPNDFLSNLNDKTFKLYSDFNFRPVQKTKDGLPDYIENKHLYFIRLMNGVTSKAW